MLPLVTMIRQTMTSEFYKTNVCEYSFIYEKRGVMFNMATKKKD